MDRSYSNPEYIEYIKQKVKMADDIYICTNCFDTKNRKIKKRDIVKMPKETYFHHECDMCSSNKNGKCTKSPIGDTLGVSDYDDIPLSHLCVWGKKDKFGNVVSMSENCCPVCHKPAHRIIGKNIIISIVGTRDCGKSHYIGILLHEMVNKMGEALGWEVLAEDQTLRRYDEKYGQLYTSSQVLNLTTRNTTGFYEPYIFYITDSNNRTFTITFFDTAGEDFESDELVENSARHAFEASGIIYLIDPLKITRFSLSLTQDLLRKSSTVSAEKAYRNDMILSSLSLGLRRHNNINANKKISTPIAIAISKLDAIANRFPAASTCIQKGSHISSKCFVKDEQNIINNEIEQWLVRVNDGPTNSFISQLKLNYSRYNFFGVSSLGMNNQPDKNGVFKQPIPHRIEDPLLWILKENGMYSEK